MNNNNTNAEKIIHIYDIFNSFFDKKFKLPQNFEIFTLLDETNYNNFNTSFPSDIFNNFLSVMAIFLKIKVI